MAEPGSPYRGVQAGLRGHGVASLSAGVQRLMEAYRSGEVPDYAGAGLRPGRGRLRGLPDARDRGRDRAAFAGLRLALPGWAPASVLDFGAGTGGASWAVAAGLGAVRLTLLEQSADAIRLGRAILAAAESASLRAATWRSWRLDAADSQDPAPGRSDLAVSAYVLGELSRPQQERLVGLAIQAAPVVLLVEPGTPAGHRRILAARDRLLAAGYAIAAPCPHQLGCPLAAAGDWCHFAARVQRSALHRQVKGADLSYEDEKFSYVAAAAPSAGMPDWPSWPGGPAAAAAQEPGHSSTCARADGRSAQLLVGKSKGEAYRRARKTSWGDRWEDEGLSAAEALSGHR